MLNPQRNGFLMHDFTLPLARYDLISPTQYHTLPTGVLLLKQTDKHRGQFGQAFV